MSARSCTRRVVVALVGASLVGHTFALYRRIPWLRAATRCPLMILVAGYVASVSPGRRREVATVVGGLVCAAVGDTVLMRESDRALLGGIAAFLGTHACYLASFLRGGALAGAGRRPLLPAGYAVAYLAAAVPLHRLLRGHPLRWPVIGYGLALFAMACAAAATGRGPGLGAGLFVLSDLTIALGLAGLRFRGQTAVVGATYVAGQLLIARHWTGSGAGTGR